MKMLILIVFTAFAAVPAWAQDTPAPSQPAPTAAPPPPPNTTPPAPPTTPEQVDNEQPPAEMDQPPLGNAPAGQWTYTEQYGWIWTPYAQDYSYIDDAGDTAFAYAYYPSYGWRWLPAPWILGWGPRPYWGRFGVNRFAWHAHPWFHVGVYRPNVWTNWGRSYGRGYVYGHSYERTGRPQGHAARGGPRGGGHR